MAWRGSGVRVPSAPPRFQQVSSLLGFDLGSIGEPSGEPRSSVMSWGDAAMARTASTSITVATAATPLITEAARGGGAGSCRWGTAPVGPEGGMGHNCDHDDP